MRREPGAGSGVRLWPPGRALIPSPGGWGRSLGIVAASRNLLGRNPCPPQNPSLDPLTAPFFLSPPPVPPTIEQGAEGAGSLVHRAGELVTMACPVRGSPPIHMSWLKDGLPLPLSQRTHLHGSGHILR